MATTTKNLDLFKYEPLTDQDELFNFDQALNDNWDIIDSFTENCILKNPNSGQTITKTLVVSYNNNPGYVTQDPTISYKTAPETSTGAGLLSINDSIGQWMGIFGVERYKDNRTVVKVQGYDASDTSGRMQLISDGSGQWRVECPYSDVTNSVVTTRGIQKSSNGYVKFGNGIIIQWGNTTVTSSKDVGLPVAFVTNFKVVVCDQSASAGGVNSVGIDYINALTKFRVYNKDNAETGFSWIAIGY